MKLNSLSMVIFRVAASLLHGLNCSELIAKNTKSYVDIAVKLGTNHQ